MSDAPFSFDAVRTASAVPLPNPETLIANDGVPLAYRRYVPEQPRAAVLFYHGGGAHSGASYQHLAHGIMQHAGAVVYTPDLRGHGRSGGARGDAASPAQVWSDVTALIKRVRTDYPNLPLFLGGHSSGAGLILNYTSQPQRELTDYYLFLAPQFGFRSKTERPATANPFATVNVFPFIVNAMSGGWLAGHTTAVSLNYPAEILAVDTDLLSSYTVNMANAVTPSAPQQQCASLDRPFGLWIGAEDEVLDPSKVVAFADLAISVRQRSEVGMISNVTHLSILFQAAEIVGAWITRCTSK